MNYFSYLRVELNRIFHSKTTWLIILLTILCPLAGFSFFQPVPVQTTSDRMIANPTMSGALGGAVLFALLTLMEFNRVHKNKTAALTDSISSPVVMNSVKLLAVGISAFTAVTLAALSYFPYTAIKMGNIFDAYTYWNSFYLLMLPSILLSVIAASAFYQIFYRFDLSFVVFIAFVILSLNKSFSDNYILSWINPIVPTLSDDFSNVVVFRLMGYNRLFWFLLLGGLWLFSMLSIRRYGRGVIGSFIRGIRKAYVPLLSVLMIGGSCFAYVNQPYIDHSPIEPVNLESTPNKQLILLNTALDISLNTHRGTLSGKAVYSIQNDSNTPQKCTLKLIPGYNVRHITANGNEISFQDLKNDTNNLRDIVFTLPESPKIELSVEYGGAPKMWSMAAEHKLYATCISDKYIELLPRELAPALQASQSKDATKITGRFTMPSSLVPVATGDTIKLISQNNDGTSTWAGGNDGSNLWLMAADYVMKKLDAGGMPIEFYYSRKHESKMRELSADDVMKSAIDYGTAHYGRLLYASGDRPVKIIQASAFQFGGKASDNFSVMGETFFSDKALGNTNEGASSAEVLAHEIIHQWWNSQCMDPQNTAWTSEGLTVYTTYRMMKEKYGDDYAQKNYVDAWKKALEAQSKSFYNRHPEYLEILPEKYASDIMMSNEGTDMYDLMPLKIYKAAQIIGEDKMDKILTGLYQNSINEEPPYITYSDFLKACNLSEEALKID